MRFKPYRAIFLFLSASLFAEGPPTALAAKGFIAPLPEGGVIKNRAGQVVWDLAGYDFAKGVVAPKTANPNLWQQLQLLLYAGLFQVTNRIYQIRGADIANMTIIEGDKGLIVVDPLLSMETAKAALALYYQHRPKKPIEAIIFSHSHLDHFGGVRGIVSEEDVALGKVKIIAPLGFTEEVFIENVLAGKAMMRRSLSMYGSLLQKGAEGQISAGLGLGLSTGTQSFILPTHTITAKESRMKIGGLTFLFMLTPNTEAPSEMHFYIPELKALSTAENAVHTMHNIYTLRGAKIRDALAWSYYVNKTGEGWGEDAEVLFGMHQWPVWGKEAIQNHLRLTADAYKYMHDQTLYFANKGLSADEIADRIVLPKVMQDYWSLRPFYGNVKQNVKSIYVYYFGWFDGNPIHLDPLPAFESSKRYIEYMGGIEAVLQKAKESYVKEEYRWVAEVLTHAVTFDPSHKEAKLLLAEAFEKLGFATETAPWRNFYLTKAKALRLAVRPYMPVKELDKEIFRALSIPYLFEYLAIHLEAKKAEGEEITLAWKFSDRKERGTSFLRNSVLQYQEGNTKGGKDALIVLSSEVLQEILRGKTSFSLEEKKGNITIEGNQEKARLFFTLFEGL